MSATATAGIPTQTSSLIRTSAPRAVKKRERPIGETSIGRQGKKNRSCAKGARSATPRPPSVKASKIPWEAIARVRYVQAGIRVSPVVRRVTATMTAPRPAAKRSECVNPRWPSRSAYAMPKRKPMTSTSGIAAANAPTIAKCRGTRWRNGVYSAAPNTAWARTVGNRLRSRESDRNAARSADHRDGYSVITRVGASISTAHDRLSR